ncbi:MAG: tetratricopeptide repeat protein [Betaproteobacteria bacterium]|nr:tetratricopeptide repeat protein [Betaproteobacteria bacterium]
MLLCSNCGATLRPSAKLCLRCGTALNTSKTESDAAIGTNPPTLSGLAEVPAASQRPKMAGEQAAQEVFATGSRSSIVKDFTASALKSGAASAQEAAVSYARTAAYAFGIKILAIGVLVVGIAAAGIFAFDQWRSKNSSESTASSSTGETGKADTSRNAIPSAVRSTTPGPTPLTPGAPKGEGRPEALEKTVSAPVPKSVDASVPAPTRPSSLDQKLSELIRAADSEGWNQVRALSVAIKQSVSVTHGDRRVARAANSDGLKALNSGNYASAVSTLQAGVQADPGDVEVRNNLGYAQLKAGKRGDAIATLEQLLLQVPDRTSAWANLSEALTDAGDLATAKSCLRIAVYFSSNRERTATFLSQTAESHPSQQFRSLVAEVLQNISAIPNDVAPKPEKKAVARLATPTPVSPGTGTNSQATSADNRPGIAEIRDALREGYVCLQSKRYDCAITSANVVLRFEPSNGQAQELRRKAKDEQEKAIGGIKVE